MRSKPAAKPPLKIFQDGFTQDDGTLVICGAQLMVHYPGIFHVRQALLKLPFFVGTPTVSLRVMAVKPRPFPAADWRKTEFVVSGIVFREETTYLNCTVTATNVWDGVSAGETQFVCNYIVTGTPRAASKRRAPSVTRSRR